MIKKRKLYTAVIFSFLGGFYASGFSTDTARLAKEQGRITVCIPAMYADIDHPNVQRFTRTLKSIDGQVVQPYEVIVAVSEATSTQSRQYEQYYRQFLRKTKLRIISSIRRGSVGMNRNRAARHAQGAIFTFFDADGDIMHPQRLQLIQWAFLLHNVDLVLHSFTAEPKSVPISFPPSVISSYALCEINRQRQGHEWLLPEIHHGHLSISRKIFKRQIFLLDYKGYEDSIFVNTAIGNSSCQNDHSAIFLNYTLSLNYLARSQKSFRGAETTAIHVSDPVPLNPN